jgi:hypothetical protein
MIFQRMADRRPVETLVERDDGVVFAMRGAGGGADLPHDLVHALVEAELGVRDGIWGCVADGVVWDSMRHVSGRRPPHAAERSERLKRERAEAIRRAEGLADLVARLARGEPVAGALVASIGAARLDTAAKALRAAARHWAGLAPGDTWAVDWPVERRSSDGRVSRAGGSGRRRTQRARAARS